MSNRIVITGIGLYSCLGTGKDEVLDSLRTGKSGIVLDENRKNYGYRSLLTGMVPQPQLKGKLNRRLRIGMHQPAQYAYISTNICRYICRRSRF